MKKRERKREKVRAYYFVPQATNEVADRLIHWRDGERVGRVKNSHHAHLRYWSENGRELRQGYGGD